ncbi:hypothetical protein [Pelomonas cellulosilytica]|uniref:Uncharacterized protein n=1 Tax=Pelomonas cellulosilytica TaxID=2906762 RepID=A0ABS8XWG2_9BURK|nr:hypothetical protein [Pelomonas sp. P8]MCE4556997.1 hypothetical protein [Pelomonas sp. P8]
MFHLLSWSVVLLLLALWSLAIWLAYVAADWAVVGAGALAGSVDGEGLLQLPEAVEAWLWPELVAAANAWLTSVGPVVEGLLQAAPALAGALTVLAWSVWGAGGVLLLLLGLGLHLLISHGRRSAPGVRPLAAG